MPVSAAELAYETIPSPDEAITSVLYAEELSKLVERNYPSYFWESKARFAEARRRLRATASLTRGWNTYDAESPNDLSRQLADRVLDQLEENLLPPARVTASAEGGVAISFVKDNRRAVIEIYNTGELAAAVYTNEGQPVVWELNADDASLQGTVNQIRVHLA
jgi:hypothetical protein